MELLQVTMVTSRVCTESPWLDNNIIGYLSKPHLYHCGNWLYMYLLFSYSRLVEELIWRNTTKPLSLQVCFIPCCSPKCAHCHFFSLKGHAAKDQSVTVFSFSLLKTSPCPTEHLLLKCQIIQVPVFLQRGFQCTRMSRQVCV